MPAHNFQDLTGMTFGRLLIVEQDLGKKRVHWKCRCECGNVVSCAAYNLKNGTSKSCGCLAKETTAIRNATHGHSVRRQHSVTYKIWAGMKKRCYTPSMAAYKYYGGRGISVCDRWLDYAAFLADMGECPPGMSIDRINPDGDYEPENCRWADAQSQRNNRRDSLRITAFGETKSIREWADQYGLPHNTIYLRIKRGAPAEEAITRPWYSREHQSAESKSRKRKA